MKKLGFLITMLVFTSLPTWSQGAKSIRITEVMTNNRTSIVDEYGLHKSWVELSNSCAWYVPNHRPKGSRQENVTRTTPPTDVSITEQ